MLPSWARVGIVLGTFSLALVVLAPADCAIHVEEGGRRCSNLVGVTTSNQGAGLVVAMLLSGVLAVAAALILSRRR